MASFETALAALKTGAHARRMLWVQKSPVAVWIKLHGGKLVSASTIGSGVLDDMEVSLDSGDLLADDWVVRKGS